MLTHDEYKALAAGLTLPTGAFINGRAQAAESGDAFASINPATGATLADVSQSGEAEVDRAVDGARRAFRRGEWSKMHPAERKAVLIELVKLLRRHSRELAVMESLESGKPIADVEAIDIPESINCLLWHAEAVDKLYDQVAPTGDDALAMVVREPVGVVAAVLPWNFPILMLAWKIGPALATGNSVIVKPAEETSMTTLRIAELALEAGVPRGVLQVLPGVGEITGRLLGLHDDVDMVTFTGSTEIGKRFLTYAGESNMKRITLECGGKNPCVVMDDAEDLDAVAQHVVNAAYWNMGENCSANSRLIVHRDVREPLLERVRHRMREWRTGDPLDPANRLGAIVTRQHHDKILSHIDTAKREGAEVLEGGETLGDGDGLYIAPTLFDGVRPEMTLAREEVFGPVLGVIEVGSEGEAIEVANDTRYGLAASVFTGNIRRAHRMAREIRAGTVSVNAYAEGDITTPFGGFGQSGFGGRDKSIHAHDQYTELKTVWLDLADPSQESIDRD